MKLATRNFVLGLLVLLAASATTNATNHPVNANANSSVGNFKVVLDSPRGNDKKTRLMLKNRLQNGGEVDLKAMVERAKKEFRSISETTRKIGGEAREIVDQFRDSLQHYTRKELGIYAALTVALTVTLKTLVPFERDEIRCDEIE
eukprot:jgi/Psemu1/288471/fgenesh1_pg.263_\